MTAVQSLVLPVHGEKSKSGSALPGTLLHSPVSHSLVSSAPGLHTLARERLLRSPHQSCHWALPACSARSHGGLGGKQLWPCPTLSAPAAVTTSVADRFCSCFGMYCLTARCSLLKTSFHLVRESTFPRKREPLSPPTPAPPSLPKTYKVSTSPAAHNKSSVHVAGIRNMLLRMLPLPRPPQAPTTGSPGL